MQTLTQGTRALRLLAHLNADRLLMTATLVGALMLGAYVGSILF